MVAHAPQAEQDRGEGLTDLVVQFLADPRPLGFLRRDGLQGAFPALVVQAVEQLVVPASQRGCCSPPSHRQALPGPSQIQVAQAFDQPVHGRQHPPQQQRVDGDDGRESYPEHDQLAQEHRLGHRGRRQREPDDPDEEHRAVEQTDPQVQRQGTRHRTSLRAGGVDRSGWRDRLRRSRLGTVCVVGDTWNNDGSPILT